MSISITDNSGCFIVRRSPAQRGRVPCRGGALPSTGYSDHTAVCTQCTHSRVGHGRFVIVRIRIPAMAPTRSAAVPPITALLLALCAPLPTSSTSLASSASVGAYCTCIQSQCARLGVASTSTFQRFTSVETQLVPEIAVGQMPVVYELTCSRRWI